MYVSIGSDPDGITHQPPSTHGLNKRRFDKLLLKTLSIFDAKNKKRNDDSVLEIDAVDLEGYSNVADGSEFIRITEKRIGTKTIYEWFAVDGVSYWWLISTTIYPKFQEVMNFIDRFGMALEASNPGMVTVNGFLDKAGIISQICKNKNVQVKFNKKFVFDLKSHMKDGIRNKRYEIITRKKAKNRLEAYHQNKDPAHGNMPSGEYVMVTSVNRRLLLTDRFGNQRRQDPVLQPIIDLLHAGDLPLVGIDIDYTLKGSATPLKDRLASGQNWMPVERFLDRKTGKSVNDKIRRLKEAFDAIQRHDLNSTFSYRGIKLWDFLKPSFTMVFSKPYLPTFVHLIERLESLFEKSRPETIIQIYETGPYEKCFEIAATKFGIKTVGIQHGSITGSVFDYTQGNIRGPDNALGNPIPGQTFVFGEHYKKILVENGGYPESRVRVTGNPTWSEIPLVRQRLNREKILERRNIRAQKIILLPLSYRLAYAKKNVSDTLVLQRIYECCRKTASVIFLVRPHPGDDVAQDTVDRLFPESNFLCSTGDLFEDLFISDLVVVTYSTVGIEAALFDKPVIYANIDKTGKTPLRGKVPYMLIEDGLAIESTLNALGGHIDFFLRAGRLQTGQTDGRRDALRRLANWGIETDILKMILEEPDGRPSNRPA